MRDTAPGAGLDPVIQHPARLQLLTMLTTVTEAEFSVLRDALDVSDSALSKHLATLGDSRYLAVRKATHSGRRTTWIHLTRAGRQALDRHIAALRAIIDTVPPAGAGERTGQGSQDGRAGSDGAAARHP